MGEKDKEDRTEKIKKKGKQRRDRMKER